MVFVNTKKFACASCIKGHRSSLCHHSDRPLFEIKKKGRPVSQCEKCRELRHSRKVHSKCECKHSNDNDSSPVQAASSSNKSRRFVPIVPALPNGLKDVLQASGSSRQVPADSRQRVDALLNPCHCKSVWKCQCRSSIAPTTPATEPLEEVGLAALARAAVTRRRQPQQGAPEALQNGATSIPSHVQTAKRIQTTKPPISRPGNSTCSSCNCNESLSIRQPPTLNLPPIFPPQAILPTFPTIPPVSAIKSLAGSRCTCGARCGCPGCVQHRKLDKASKHHEDCTDGCQTCIDYDGGIELPTLSASPSSGTSIIDQFFARAAALPQPPINRKMGIQLNPMDVNVYREAKAFELVNLPKLECCNGRCGCPGGHCGCGKFCDGDCTDHGNGPAVQRNLAPVDTSLVLATGETSTSSTCRSPSPLGVK